MSFHGRFSPENKALKNAANGYAGLDGSSKLTVGQLPLATGAAAGAVIVGTNLTVTAGTLSLSNANVLAAIGFTPAGLTGNTFTGTQVTPAATTALASLRIPHGAAPTTPTNGDVWSTTAALFVRLNGATATLAQLGAQSFTGLQTFSAGLTVSAGTITLPATSISDAALSANVVLENAANVFTNATNQFAGIKLREPSSPTYGLQVSMNNAAGGWARGLRYTHDNNANGADTSLAEFGALGGNGVLTYAVLGWGTAVGTPLAYNGGQWVVMFANGNVNIGSQTTDQGFQLFVNGTAKVNTALTVGNGFTVSAGTVSLPAASIADAALSANVVLENVASTFSTKITTVASATGTAGFNLPHGVAPTTPTNGDLWTTTTAAFVRLNSTTATLAQLGAQSFTGLQTFGAGLTVSAGAVTLPAASVADAALSANVVLENVANTFTTNLQTFATTLAVSGSAGLPAASVSSTLHVTGGGTTPNGVKMYWGDGSGWTMTFNTRAASVDTIRHTFTDTGNYTSTGRVTAGNGLTVSAGTVVLPAGSVGDAALTSNVPLKNGTNVYTGSNEFQGLIKQGDGNQDILEKKSAEIETHDRNTVTAVSANIITSITEKDGATIVKTTTFSYLGSGNLNTIVIVAGGKTTTVTYSYDGNGNFTGTTRTVV